MHLGQPRGETLLYERADVRIVADGSPHQIVERILAQGIFEQTRLGGQVTA